MKVHEDLVFDKNGCQLVGFTGGIFSNLQFPYAHFATQGATAAALYPLVWEAVQRLEYCGFNVIALQNS